MKYVLTMASYATWVAHVTRLDQGIRVYVLIPHFTNKLFKVKKQRSANLGGDKFEQEEETMRKIDIAFLKSDHPKLLDKCFSMKHELDT